ncbi:ABC transporter ATP-binding protein [Ancylobacter pratisalsi]|nr:ATP-binding cassette domain-containing protein [Ancylobacter pratisalsi]
MTSISLTIADKRYPSVGGAPAREIFHDFRLDVAAHEFVVLLGASGLGKTTLLNIVAGLDTAFRGDVNFGSPSPRIAYAFQSPRLLPWRTVLENVVLPLPSGPAAREGGLAMLHEVGLADLADAYPERLSLGQQRRVALARAFVIGPDVLLMDEPFVSLDEASATRLRLLLRSLLLKRAATVLFVTHDGNEAAALASRIVLLEGAPARVALDVVDDLTPQDRASTARVEAFRRRVGLSVAD